MMNKVLLALLGAPRGHSQTREWGYEENIRTLLIFPDNIHFEDIIEKNVQYFMDPLTINPWELPADWYKWKFHHLLNQSESV